MDPASERWVQTFEQPHTSLKKDKKNIEVVEPYFEMWILQRALVEGKEKSWKCISKEQLQLSSDDLEKEVQKRGRSSIEDFTELEILQQRQVKALVEDRQAEESHPDAEWTWARIQLDMKSKSSQKSQEKAGDARGLLVILQRRSIKPVDKEPKASKSADKAQPQDLVDLGTWMKTSRLHDIPQRSKPEAAKPNVQDLPDHYGTSSSAVVGPVSTHYSPADQSFAHDQHQLELMSQHSSKSSSTTFPMNSTILGSPSALTDATSLSDNIHDPEASSVEMRLSNFARIPALAKDEDIASLVSVEDDVQSLAESTTSPDTREIATNYLVSILMGDQELLDIYKEALSKLGEEKFIRNHRHLLKSFFLDARSEAQNPLHFSAVSLLRTRSRRISISYKVAESAAPTSGTCTKDALDKDVGKLAVLERYLSTQQAQSEDEDNSEDESKPSHLDEAVKFLTRCKAYDLYKSTLRRYIRGLPPIMDAFEKAIQERNIDMVRDMLQNEATALCRGKFEWLNDLFGLGYPPQEIAEAVVLEKDVWLYYSPPILRCHIICDVHQPNCAHACIPNPIFATAMVAKATSSSAISLHENIVKQTVVEVCGLGGVIPTSPIMSEWNGKVQLLSKDSSASVSFGLRSDISSRLDFIIAMKPILEAIDMLTNICGWLQENGLCCSSFTILVWSSVRNAIEVMPVPFRTIREMQNALRNLDFGPRETSLQQALIASFGALNIFVPNLMTTDLMEHAYTATCHDLQRSLLDCAALAVQALNIGLVSYSSAHLGQLDLFFLDQKLKCVVLGGVQGSISSDVSLRLELLELDCAGEMLGDRVLVFTSTNSRCEPNVKSQLLVSPEDLIETWGPGKLIAATDTGADCDLYAIAICGGLVCKLDEKSPLLHWQLSLPESLTITQDSLCYKFNAHVKILIGGRAVTNTDCPLAGVALQSIISEVHYEFLGTSRDRWSVNEKQLGIQAGQYAVLFANVTWSKTKGITLKDRSRIRMASTHTFEIAFLEASWGLLISFCTGVAQRVPLREVIAEVMPAIVEAHIPLLEGWHDLLEVHNAIANLRSPNFESWVKRLPSPMQTVLTVAVNRVLVALHDTGFDKETEELVVACVIPRESLRCFRIICKDHQVWAKILHDSSHCATFACMTTKCLETKTRLCRKGKDPSWHVQPVLLATAVSQWEINRSGQCQVVVSELEAGVDYWFGESKEELIARWVAPDIAAETRLEIEPCRVPPRVLNILRTKRPSRRLQEKQSVTDSFAKNVLLLDRQDK